ncbi:MAG: hypothetical protein IT385_24640 [Deltaproteobacteria bacterium]|nr:hypothetical protein [Deltaproteobacteria bacterium]
MKGLVGQVGLVGALALAATLVGCPDDEGGGDADAADALPGGRSFVLAARAEGYDPSAREPWVATLDALTLTGDATTERPVEALVVPLDLVGIPWDAFIGPDNAPTSLPAPWLAAVDAQVALAQAAGLPIVLALSPISPDFDTLAPLAKDGAGALVLDDAWEIYCYDPSKDSNPARYRDRFAGFAVWAVGRFQPTTVVLGQRVNRYEATCGRSAYDAILAYVEEAARRVRALASAPAVAVSVDVEDLYGYPDKPGRCQTGTPQDCLASRQALVVGAAAAIGDDGVLGLESYPARALADLDELPADWLKRVADLVPAGQPSAVLGAGLPVIRLETPSGVCTPLLEASEGDQRAFLDQVLAVADLKEMTHVVWRGLLDLAPAAVVGSCPCAGDATLCQHLSGLGASRDERRLELVRGLWTHDGTPRQAVTLWRAVLEGDR